LFASSFVMPLVFALHSAILLSYFFFSALKQSLMNFFRSSPFLSPA
jgi:hypothetical protein